MDLGEVLGEGGRSDEAGGAVEAALALYVRKGDVASSERARARLREGNQRTEGHDGQVQADEHQ
jgi:hypothetical protein